MIPNTIFLYFSQPMAKADAITLSSIVSLAVSIKIKAGDLAFRNSLHNSIPPGMRAKTLIQKAF